MILNLEEGSGKSLYERIYEYIKKEILDKNSYDYTLR